MSEAAENAVIWTLAVAVASPIAVAAYNRLERGEKGMAAALAAIAALVTYACLIGFGQSFSG